MSIDTCVMSLFSGNFGMGNPILRLVLRLEVRKKVKCHDQGYLHWDPICQATTQVEHASPDIILFSPDFASFGWRISTGILEQFDIYKMAASAH